MRSAHGALALLAGIAACLGAVAYAATPRHPAGSAADPKGSSIAASLPRPAITQHPAKLATSESATFGFRARGHDLRFQCRLDARAWSACRNPVVFTRLTPGQHGFTVRVLGRGGRHGRPARFRWSVLAPKSFSIMPQLAGLDDLYPGAPPLALPLTIANPNSVPIFVTGLRATANSDPLGCTSAQNLILTASSASSATPLKVPAGGSANLPASGISAPTIQLRNLPVDQDPCQGGRFPLAFTGEARG